MTTKIKVTLGQICELLDEHIKAVNPYMEYGCQEQYVTKTGLFSSTVENVPFDDHMDYWWQCMVNHYPWTQLKGVFEASEMLPKETEVYVDCVIFDKLFLG